MICVGQMFKTHIAPTQPKARGYFGIDAKVYGHMGHVDPSALKVGLCCVNRALHERPAVLGMKCCIGVRLSGRCISSALPVAFPLTGRVVGRRGTGRQQRSRTTSALLHALFPTQTPPPAQLALAPGASVQRARDMDCPENFLYTTQVPSADHIYACASALNSFNDGWSPTAPSGC